MIGPKTSVILQKPVETRTTTGGQSSSWQQVQEFDAVILPLSAVEREIYSRRGVVATYRMLVDYSIVTDAGGIKEKNRIKVGSTIYNIVGVVNYHNRHFEVDLQVVS